jgi:hypothetical protein
LLHRHFTLRTIGDAAFREKLDIHLARSGSIRKKAKDCHVRTQKKILNERKKFTSKSAFFNPCAISAPRQITNL